MRGKQGGEERKRPRRNIVQAGGKKATTSHHKDNTRPHPHIHPRPCTRKHTPPSSFAPFSPFLLRLCAERVAHAGEVGQLKDADPRIEQCALTGLGRGIAPVSQVQLDVLQEGKEGRREGVGGLGRWGEGGKEGGGREGTKEGRWDVPADEDQRRPFQELPGGPR